MTRRLVAAAAAVALLAGCDGGGGEADPAPSAATSDAPSTTTDTSTATSAPTPTGDPGPVVACPRAVQEPDPRLPDAVPDGATSVRLCDGGDDRVTPPADALTTDVASLVSAVNGQPVVDRPCVDRQLPTYQLAFGYPDGSRFVVAGRFTGCAELLVGSDRRAKAGPPLRSFVDLLQAQRSNLEPPRAPRPASLDCAQEREAWTWPLGNPTGLAVAVLCVGPADEPERARRVEVPADALRTMVRSIRTDTRPTGDVFACGGFDPDQQWIVGATHWGDPIVLTRECAGFLVTDDREWRPRGKARQVIDRLLQKAR